MSKILLLTLYYPPLNSAASLRMYSFKKYLELQGNKVDVITRYYKSSDNKINDENIDIKTALFNNDNFFLKKENIYYLSFDSNRSIKMATFKKLPPVIKGLYAHYNFDIYHYDWYESVLKLINKEHLHIKKYDFILASFPPLITLFTANVLSEKFNVPWLADFRDCYITNKDNFLHRKIKELQLKNILKNSSAMSVVSNDFFKFFPKNINIPFIEIQNGIEIYDKNFDNEDIEIIKEVNKIKEKSDLLLAYTGSLKLSLKLGLKADIFYILNLIDFINSNENLKINVVFIGLNESTKRIMLKKNYSFVNIMRKVAHNTSIFIQQKADALILPVIKQQKYYSGLAVKIYEYIYSEKPLIINPYPCHEDLKRLLDKSPNAYYFNYEDDKLKKFLIDLANGKIKPKKMKNKDELLRSKQVEKLYKFMLKL